MTCRTVLLTAILALAATAPAAARDFAPVDRPGPPLSPTAAQLAASLSCDDDIATAARPAVLLTAGTEVTEDKDFGWNWKPALRARGFPVCTVEQAGQAGRNTEDIQTRAEYVAYAIRRAYELGGRRPIGIVGHSQGGQVMRWSLRWWPDTRAMVSDVVALAPTNHGSPLIHGLCVGGCAPALWQQLDSSDYVRALNSGQETFAGISYTNVYTRLDQFVQPNLDDTGTSSLHTGDGRITNEAVQDVCPANTSEHLLVGTADPVAWALGLDALTHDGPADPGRIDRGSVCAQAFMPGVDPVTFPGDFAAAGAQVAHGLLAAPRVPAEPELACYVYADCPIPAAPAPAPAPVAAGSAERACPASRRVRVGRAHRVRLAGRSLRITRSVRTGRTVVVRFTGRQRVRRLAVTERTTTGRLRTRTVVVRRCGPVR